jgi:hypothetical protein
LSKKVDSDAYNFSLKGVDTIPKVGYNGDTKKGDTKMDDKAKRLANIMFEEDEYRDANGMELMYHTREDFEAEKKEREENK